MLKIGTKQRLSQVMNSVTRQKKNLILDWNRKLSYVATAERNIKSI